MTYKHKVESRRDVIVGGMVYKPDRDGIVMLPVILENADVTPIDRPAPTKPETPGDDGGSTGKNAPADPPESDLGYTAGNDAGDDTTGDVANLGDDETGNDPATNEGDE